MPRRRNKLGTSCGHGLEAPSTLDDERKLVTVLFADLKGSMELMPERDPEEVRRPLVAQTRVRRAELWQRQGERDRAAEDLAVTGAMLEEMDMRPWLTRAQAGAPRHAR